MKGAAEMTALFLCLITLLIAPVHQHRPCAGTAARGFLKKAAFRKSKKGAADKAAPSLTSRKPGSSIRN